MIAGLCLPAVGIISTTPVQAQQNALRIAAVVNDDIISMYDVSTRMRITLHSARMPATQANSKRMLPQVIRSLINEKLQEQQAKSLGVSLSDEELARSVRRVEQSNRMPAGGMKKLADALGVPYDAMIEQIRISTLWAKTVGRQYARQTRVSDSDAQDRLQQLQNNLGKPEHLVSEIYLPYNAANNPQEIKNLAEDLVAQLRQGAPFVIAAQQFSRSPTAGRGGSLGWVPQGQLEPELDLALAQMQEGQISNPIATQNGYYILQLAQRRVLSKPDLSKTKLRLSQIKLPLVGEKALTPEDQAKVIAYVQQSIRGCKDFDAYGKTLGTKDSGALGSMQLNEIPAHIQQVVSNLDIGQPSQTIELGGAPTVLMVCERIVPSALPSLETIKNQIQTQRMERNAQRLLNELRRDAVVDIRM